jgi:hypothetical protein
MPNSKDLLAGSSDNISQVQINFEDIVNSTGLDSTKNTIDRFTLHFSDPEIEEVVTDLLCHSYG